MRYFVKLLPQIKALHNELQKREISLPMQKTIIYIQTLFVLLLLFPVEGFNLSLSIDTAFCTHSCKGQYQEQQYFGRLTPELGKVIKESTIAKADYKIKTVVIDPGHGGHDPGCLGRSSREKHLALAIGQQLAAILKQQFPNIQVIMTRDKDVFVPLYERAAIANRANADLFISIHCNSMPPGNTHVHGTETYVMGLHTATHNLNVAKRENSAILLEDNYEKNYDYDPNSPEGHIMLSMYQNAYLEQSILFAERVEAQFNTYAQRKSRGVKQAGFVVLKETTMPSVLVEAGFLSNRKEENYLRTKNGQRAIAYSILQAFIEYKALIEDGKQSPISIPPPIAVNEVLTERRPLPDTPAPSEAIPDTELLAAPPSFQVPAKVQEERSTTYQSTAESEPRIISSSPPISNPAPFSGAAMHSRANSDSQMPVQFHVQLAASPNPMDTSQPRWKNLGYLIEVIPEDQLYKYQARNFSTLEQAVAAKDLLQSKGFSDAFVVAYKNGKRISVEQAKSEVSE